MVSGLLNATGKYATGSTDFTGMRLQVKKKKPNLQIEGTEKVLIAA